jgi:glycosyltransferase involved in cell wall biosynthesis
VHIGVVPDGVASNGGVFQYSLAILDALSAFPKANGDSLFTMLLRPGASGEFRESFGNYWPMTELPDFGRDRLLHFVRAYVGNGLLRDALVQVAQRFAPGHFFDPERIRPNTGLRDFLTRQELSWVLHTAPNVSSFESGIPFVMPIHDLQHRLQPEFPEVSAHGVWERREYLFRNGVRQATLIIADSEVGKEDILNCYGSYGITDDRIKVLPYVPAPYLSRGPDMEERSLIRAAYGLPERFLFYPAQFWPHKNHLRIIKAMRLLKESSGIEVQLVLCGSHVGGIRERIFKETMDEIGRSRLTQQIHCLGYVPNSAMSALYAEAAGLVMPTFFGPTNIPILEAWHLGCPVLTSDIRGVREQAGDAAILVDPESIEGIADGMRRLWEDDDLGARLTKRGAQRAASFGQQDFREQLYQIISEANLRVSER